MWMLMLGCQQPDKDSEPALQDSARDSGDSGEILAPAWSGAAWCARVAAAPPGSGDPLIELSAAHATIRLFGAEAEMVEADGALIALLEQAPPWDTQAALAIYAEALPDTCAVEANGAAPGVATVELRGDVAWVRPGSGEVALSAGAASVVVDLRGLPEGEGVGAMVEAAAGLALAAEVARPDRGVRIWDGFVDQVFSASNVYSVVSGLYTPAPIAAGGAADLPLAFVIGERIAPSAARVAADLRIAGRAALVGQELPMALAESRWLPVGGAGLLHPGEITRNGTEISPEVLMPDLATDDPDAALGAGVPAVGALGEPGTRALLRRGPFNEAPSEALTPGTSRAALVVAHGVLRRFYPYFALGDTVDGALVALLAEPTPADRWGAQLQVARLGAELGDGHTFWGALDGSRWPEWAGYAGLVLDHPAPDDPPVVVESAVEGIEAGDTLVSVGGVPVADLHAEIGQYWHAATPGYTANLIDRHLRLLEGDTEIVALAPDGATHTGIAAALSADQFYASLERSALHPIRPHGRLDDLGAPEIAYIDINADQLASESALDVEIAAAQGAAGLIIDGRGYPAIFGSALAERLTADPMRSARFLTPRWTGPEGYDVNSEQYTVQPRGDTFDGPLVILIGPVTVSAAEDVLLYLESTSRAYTLVGRQTAGTNGNITGMKLPGGLYLTFTGMELLRPDGDQFHGVGLLPDVEVRPTPAGLAADQDAELLAAVAYLQGQ